MSGVRDNRLYPYVDLHRKRRCPTFAGTITLDFGSLVSTAIDAQIQSYIDGLLPAGDSVVVTGAAGSCNTNGNGCPYQADGHIVGPVSGNTVTS